MPKTKSNKKHKNRLDSLSELKDWGFQDNACAHCGIVNSEISGVMIQCAKCKLAQYCGMKCFNADLQNHVSFCNSGTLTRDAKVSKSDMLAKEEEKKEPEEPKKPQPDDDDLSNTVSTTSNNDSVSEIEITSDQPEPSINIANEDLTESYSEFQQSGNELGRQFSPSHLEILEEEVEIREQKAQPEKEMLVLKIEEIEEEDEEDQVHPLFLYVDEGDIRESDNIVWLVREDETEDFTMVRQEDQEEEIEIIRSGGGSAMIPEDELGEDGIGDGLGLSALDEGDEDDDREHYLNMDLPPGQVPDEDQFQQEAVCLYATEKNDATAKKSKSAHWAKLKFSLKSVAAFNAAEKKPAAPEKPPTWVSSRTLKKTNIDPDVKRKEAVEEKKKSGDVPDWIKQRLLRRAADLWRAPGAGDNVRLYQRVDPAAAGGSSDCPSDVQDASVLFQRVPVRPVGTRIVRSSASDLEEDPNERSFRSSGRGGGKHSNSQLLGGEDLSERSLDLSERTLRSSGTSSRGMVTSFSKPTWALNSPLKDTGLRRSLLTSDGTPKRIASVANVHVPWKNRTKSSASFASASGKFSVSSLPLQE